MLAGSAFWDVIRAQLEELRSAETTDDVLRILSRERNPYEHDRIAGNGFFAGSGGDDTVYEALYDAGWITVWYVADYYWCMRKGDSLVTYVEGDIYRGDTKHPGRGTN